MQTPLFSPFPFYGPSPLGPSEDKGLRTHTGPVEEELPVWKPAGWWWELQTKTSQQRLRLTEGDGFTS